MLIVNTSINQSTSSTSSTPSPSTPFPSTPSSTSGNVFEKSEPVNNFTSYVNKILSSAFSFISKY